MIETLLMVGMFLVAVFLILLILVQRGRGGGLAGALGGMGGQSAFGTKAGDLFTRITIVTATIWIILCMLSVNNTRKANPLATGVFGSNAPASQPGGAHTQGPGATESPASSETPPAGESTPATTPDAKPDESKE